MSSWLLDKILDTPTPSASSDAKYEVGQPVEYFSATLKNWMPAKILQFNVESNTYNLDCKPEVPPNRIRPLGSDATPGSTPVGVAGVGGGGDSSPASRVTQGLGGTARPAESDVASPFLGTVAGEDLGSGAAQHDAISDDPFGVGAQVEYFSATAQSWIPAKVQYINSDGTFNLDCKPLVTRDRIRPMRRTTAASPAALPAAASPASATGTASATGSGGEKHQFQPNSMVEYLSGTLNQWISARVLSLNNDGTYNLDCKPLVAADRIRAPGGGDKPRVLDDIKLEDNPGRPDSIAKARPPSTMAVIPEIESFADHPMKSAQTIKSLDGPIQLVRMNKGSAGETKFEVCKEAVEVLRGMGSVKISVVSVGGTFRSGKSFLLNLLLDRMQQGLPGFQVGLGQGSYTKGIWMFALKPTAEDGHCYLYLDCEGFGAPDAENSRDPKLLALSILMSSLFILNSKGPLNEQTFQALNLVCELQKSIEDQGVIMNKPSLFWLLRDHSLSIEDTYGNPFSADEYLERALSSSPDYPFDREKAQQAKETRMAIFKFFPDRRCRTLVNPALDESAAQRLPAENYSSLRPEFRTQFARMQDEIYRLSSALGPKRVGKDMAYLTARAFPSFLAHLCDTLNNNQKLEICNSWDRVAESSCCNSVENLTAEYREALDLLRTKFPMSDSALQADLKALRQHMKARYMDESLGDEGMRNLYWQELKDGIALDDKKLWADNNQAAENKLLRVLTVAAGGESGYKFPPEVLKDVENQLKEKSIPSGCCHAIGALLLKAYQHSLDNSRLSEQRMKEHEEEKTHLRTSIAELEETGKSTSEEMQRLQDRVAEVTKDLEEMKKRYDEECQASKELREHIETMAAGGTDKEKELARAIQEADSKYRKEEQRYSEAVDNERKKREDERERFDRERNLTQQEILRLKEEHREALQREHESATNAWSQLRVQNENNTNLQTRMDTMQAELAKKQANPCKCVIM
ncbi:unnamed protein product [Amoebophrya sp. A25]|nr:unnamed protein product [Amoebophrya sp. A25]|eukprot:GSA25T00000786001.1